MPLQRPTLSQIDSDIQADIRSRLTGTNPALRRSFLGAVARGLAGALHGLYGYLARLADQLFASSAEEAQLERQAMEWGLERIAAKKAAGTLTTTGTAGTNIPLGTEWQASSGQRYRSTAAAVVGPVAVEAVEAGKAGNAAAAAELSLLSPIAGVVSTATAAAGLTGGADVESVDALRARLLFRKRNPPGAGRAADYRIWADAARAEAHRTWVAPLSQMRAADPRVLGTVIVYYAPDDIALLNTGRWDTADADYLAAIAAVDAYIQARRPATAVVTVRAPATQVVNFTISAVTPNTAAVRAAIEAELRDLIHRETEPGGTLLISHIREAISGAQGETDHNLTVPAANVVAPQHTILTMGTITWT